MVQDRDAMIQEWIDGVRAILWAFEHRDRVMQARSEEPWLAVYEILEGADVSEAAAREALGRVSLEEWTESEAEALRRALQDLEVWLADGDELHPAERRALAPILADLARTGGPTFRFQREPVHPGDDLMLIAWQPDGSGTGVWVDPFGSDERNIWYVADKLQEATIESLHRAWPECPRHPDGHPLTFDEAGWRCPGDGTYIADFGRLGEVAERPKPQA